MSEQELERREKLYNYYYSEYVAFNMPHVLEIPFEEFVRRELSKTLEDYRRM